MAEKSLTQCCIKGCENKVHGCSMCSKHLSRFRKHGDPLYRDDYKIVRAKGFTLEERFWSKVDKNGPTQPHMESECWVWIAGPSKRYGLFGFHGEQDSAHRWSYRIEHKLDDIPEGLFVCHRCDFERCVRPDHLFLGTPLENMQDKNGKGRGNYTAWRLEKPECQPRGERINTAKLTEEDVRQIREVYASVKSKYGMLTELATAYGVGRHTIFKAVHGQTWAHVK